jgi:hypothetical protein
MLKNLNMAIKIQPQLFCSLCLICWGQTLYYAKYNLTSESASNADVSPAASISRGRLSLSFSVLEQALPRSS